jgi:hypothetical protein
MCMCVVTVSNTNRYLRLDTSIACKSVAATTFANSPHEDIIACGTVSYARTTYAYAGTPYAGVSSA